MGVVKVTRPIFNSDAHNRISGTIQASVTKFFMQVEYTQCQPWDDRLPLSGRGQGHVTTFYNFAPIISLESVKLGTIPCYSHNHSKYDFWHDFASKGVLTCSRNSPTKVIFASFYHS